MALTQNEQQAVNDLAETLTNISSALDGVLTAAQGVRDDLTAMTTEEGREEAERTRLEGVVASMETDVIGALTPLSEQAHTINDRLASPPTPDAPLSTTN